MTNPETGANLTEIVNNKYPSLFEILSQDNLATGLQSAIVYVAKFLAYHQPQNFGWLYRNCDEVVLLLNAAVQYHYLKTRGGTLSEAFYGIQRIVNPAKSNLTLPLASAVLFPYIEQKLENLINNLNEVDQSQQLEEPNNIMANLDNTTKTKLLKYHSYITSVLKIIKLYYYLMYSLGKSNSHSFLFAILGWRLFYSSPETQTSLLKERNGWRWALFTLGESVLPVLEFGSFLVQFVNWWQTEKQRDFISSPVPEPFDGNYNLDKAKCPLCNQIRKNCTALRTSGIVYCYGCITKFLKQEAKCPVTGIPSDMQQLVRIYE